MELSPKSVARLLLGKWLNDEVINSYLSLLETRSVSDPRFPRIKVLDSFFWNSFCKRGFNGVKGPFKNFDATKCELILFPVNTTHPSAHWSLGVIDLKFKNIMWFDSIHIDRSNELEKLATFIAALLNLTSTENYQKFNVEVPMQLNSVDCGAFLCAYAEAVSRRAPLVFENKIFVGLNLRILLKTQLFSKTVTPISLAASTGLNSAQVYRKLINVSKMPIIEKLSAETIAHLQNYYVKYAHSRHPKHFTLKLSHKKLRIYPKDVINVLRAIQNKATL